ncbi:ABC transporter permease subunit [Texas Phoenix palm phytoplasma]|uniref:ABC transporter permease subunit n=1 Tax=Texas Phoenix palm phytoplasma TaxID=176709 RepID=A0ABS5BIB5_9MOLU|nr:sugar ABC transporter permease [Texas Phoenix palm phytoplasma]MBP3059334.1 ABC transporter permease subunit [Texas Phoenix palm phytoplasma]
MFEIIGYKNNKHWFYLAPSLIVLFVFTFYPLTKTIIISFNKHYDKFNDIFSLSITNLFSFVNYKNVFNDYEFRFALLNTLILVLFSVPISLSLALLIALSLNSLKNVFLKNTFKTVFFLPFLSNTVVMGMVFSVFFYYNFTFISDKPDGLFNSFLNLFGIKSQNWVNASASYGNKMFALIFYNVWTRLSFKVFVFVLALQDINKSYYNSAKIDGTSRWRIFSKITLPLIMPIIFYQFIIEMLSLFKEYESVVGLFGKQTNYKIQTIVGYIYSQLYSSSVDSYSKGAAAAVILLLISILCTTISFYFSKKRID